LSPEINLFVDRRLRPAGPPVFTSCSGFRRTKMLDGKR
jgi:hypothetical protein